MMTAAVSRSDLAALLKRDKKKIIGAWVAQVFKIPGYNRLKNIIPLKKHMWGMTKYVDAMILDIKYPSKHYFYDTLRRLVLKDYLSANKIEDVIHSQIILRGVLVEWLIRLFKKNTDKLKDTVRFINTAVDREILYLSKVYERRDFLKIETIIKYGKKLITIYDSDKLGHLIIEAAIKESDADRASLMLLEKDGRLHIKSSIGIPKHIVSTTSQRVGVGIAGKVAKTGKSIIINEGESVEAGIKRYLYGLGLASAVSIPLVSQNRVIGVLNLGKYSKKPFFNNRDVELLSIFAYEAAAAITNCRLFNEFQDLSVGSIISLATALETRDQYTKGHSSKVTEYATAVARKLKLSSEQIDRIHCASMLHDIGKIGVPDNILNKPGKLTLEEFEVIKKHPIFGVSILKHIPRLKPILPIVYHEHERYDGKGYLDGLRGSRIPLESRIIAIADAYDAMTSNRPYRKALPNSRALAELKKGSGTQFDPTVVKAFISIYK